MLLKASITLKPNTPRIPVETWDPDVVLDFIDKMPSNHNLSVYRLSQKAFVLMLLATGRRKGDLILMSTHNSCMTITDHRITFVLPKPTKGFKGSHNNFMQVIPVPRYPDNSKICPYTTLKDYMSTCRNRSLCFEFWVTTTPPYGPAHPDTLRRWAKTLLKDAGIEIDLFSVHSTRGVVSTRAVEQGEPLDLVMQKCAWASSSAFYEHYYRPSKVDPQKSKHKEFYKVTEFPPMPTLRGKAKKPPKVKVIPDVPIPPPSKTPRKVRVGIPKRKATRSTKKQNKIVFVQVEKQQTVTDTPTETADSEQEFQPNATSTPMSTKQPPSAATGTPPPDHQQEAMVASDTEPLITANSESNFSTQDISLEIPVETDEVVPEPSAIQAYGSIAISELFPDVKVKRIVLIGVNRNYLYTLPKGVTKEAFRGQFVLLADSPMELGVICSSGTTEEPETLVDITINEIKFKARRVPIDAARNVLSTLL